jgi:hypothetical protein
VKGTAQNPDITIRPRRQDKALSLIFLPLARSFKGLWFGGAGRNIVC